MALMDGNEPNPEVSDLGTGDPPVSDPAAGNQDPEAPQAPEWLTVQDETLRSDEALKTLGRFKTLDDFAKSHLELRKVVGEHPVKVPGADASDEEREAFYKAVGRPDAPDAYAWTAVEGIEIEPDMDKGFRETAHKYGLTQEQADGVNLFIANTAKEFGSKQKVALDQVRSETEKTLKQEFGKDYDSSLRAGDNALVQVFGQEAVKKLMAAGLHVDADIIRGAVRLAKSIGEAGLKGTGDTRPSDTLSRSDLETMMKDPRYRDPAKRDVTFVKRVEEGFRKLAANE